MATLPAIQQPKLRAYLSFDRLPNGCIMFPVTDDDAWPIFRPGEIVIVDPRQRDPVHGELFVIEYGKGDAYPRKCLVETFSRVIDAVRAGATGAKPEACWYTGAYNRPRTADELRAWLDAGRRGGMVDGPVGSDEAGLAYMRDRIIGRVVGILEPKFDETKLKRVN